MSLALRGQSLPYEYAVDLDLLERALAAPEVQRALRRLGVKPGEPLKIEAYEHPGGFRVLGRSGRWWVYVSAPSTDVSLVKLLLDPDARRALERLGAVGRATADADAATA